MQEHRCADAHRDPGDRRHDRLRKFTQLRKKVAGGGGHLTGRSLAAAKIGDVVAGREALRPAGEEDRARGGTPGTGVLVSDTLMFERAGPKPSDPWLSSVYGLALPLVNHGIPIEPVQLEDAEHAGLPARQINTPSVLRIGSNTRATCPAPEKKFSWMNRSRSDRKIPKSGWV